MALPGSMIVLEKLVLRAAKSVTSSIAYMNLSIYLSIQELQLYLEIRRRINELINRNEQGKVNRHKPLKTDTVGSAKHFTTKLMCLHI